jgi:hypothetical protein
LSVSAQEELTAMLTRQGFTRYMQRDTGYNWVFLGAHFHDSRVN